MHTATIVTTVQLIDAMSPALGMIQNAQALVAQGETAFVEVGFGGVLTNLVKRIDRAAERTCVQDAESFESFVARCATDEE